MGIIVALLALSLLPVSCYTHDALRMITIIEEEAWH